MTRFPLGNFDDLVTALKRFEELFGAADGSPENLELRAVSRWLRAYEQSIAAAMSATSDHARSASVARASPGAENRRNLPVRSVK